MGEQLVRNPEREQAAVDAAEEIDRLFNAELRGVRDGIILGSGWNQILRDRQEIQHERSFTDLTGFKGLPRHPTHPRTIGITELGPHKVVVLNGRVHMNEAPFSTAVCDWTRLQVEMLFQLGVRRLVLTCSAGSLMASSGHEGDILFLKSFARDGGTVLPLYGGEFVNPVDALDPDLRKLALSACPKRGLEGGYFYWRGPDFESLEHDKPRLRESGASVVGMSMLPEAAVAALYQREGVRVLGIAYVSNDMFDPMSDETHRANAKRRAKTLHDTLVKIYNAFPTIDP